MDKDESQGLLKIEEKKETKMRGKFLSFFIVGDGQGRKSGIVEDRGEKQKDENERGEFPSLGNPEIERKIWKFSPSHKKKNRISKEN